MKISVVNAFCVTHTCDSSSSKGGQMWCWYFKTIEVGKWQIQCSKITVVVFISWYHVQASIYLHASKGEVGSTASQNEFTEKKNHLIFGLLHQKRFSSKLKQESAMSLLSILRFRKFVKFSQKFNKLSWNYITKKKFQNFLKFFFVKIIV